jgi:hypothetical protein
VTGLVIWLRRGIGRPLAVALLAFVLTSLLSQPDWPVELDWGIRLTAASLVVVSPCVAAAAAFDTSRRLMPTLAMLSRGSVRHPFSVALPALAVVAWSVAVYVVVWAVAAAFVVRRGGVGITDWWVFPEIVAPLFGAGMVGLVVGLTLASRWAAVAAAVAVMTASVAAVPWGRGAFEALTTYGTLTGLERPSARAAAVVVGVVVVALGCLVAARELNRPSRARRLVLAACATVVGVAALAPAAWPWRQDVYVFTTEPYGCVGRAPAVCGPQSRLPLLRPVQASLADAYRALDGTEFVGPRAFSVERVDHYSHLAGAAPLDFDPAFLRGDRYDTVAVAGLLLRPHQCRALFDASGAGPILEAQSRVQPWLVAVLRGGIPARPVPAEVSADFDIIQQCAQMTGDLH